MVSTTTKTKTINWTGQSGQQYKYWIHPIGTNFKSEGGNYIFAKEISPNRWQPVYIGQTSDLSERFDNHHKEHCIKSNGATHIHVHTNASETSRLAEERDLIQKWDPVCNG